LKAVFWADGPFELDERENDFVGGLPPELRSPGACDEDIATTRKLEKE
jgi:hypothetical protein